MACQASFAQYSIVQILNLPFNQMAAYVAGAVQGRKSIQYEVIFAHRNVQNNEGSEIDVLANTAPTQLKVQTLPKLFFFLRPCEYHARYGSHKL